MASSNRTARVAQQMQVELSKIIGQKMKDPRVGLVTITGVEVTRDFAYAKVYIVLRDKEAKEKETLAVLNKGAGFLRKQLADSMLLRVVPALSFHYDNSADYGRHIDKLLREVDVDDEQEETD